MQWLDQENASEWLSDCQDWKNQTPEIKKRAFDDEDRQDSFLDCNVVRADEDKILLA